jgi:uncharacterized protein YxeA
MFYERRETMYKQKAIKVFLIVSCMFIIIAIAMLVSANIETNTMESAGTMDGRLEFISGENVYQNSNGKLALDIDSFEKVGDQQYFSLTFKNNNCYTAYATITVNAPTEYFAIQADDKLVIKPGESQTYRFSIQLAEAPKSSTSFDIGFTMRTEYLP